MPERPAGRIVVLLLVASVAGCRGGTLLRQYEYEEESYLSLDGSATVYVNASVPALVSLRGADLDIDPRARLDRAKVRAFYTAPGARVSRVSTSRRDSRRFVHVRLEVDDIRTLSRATPFSWSRYQLDRRDGLYVFTQMVGSPTGPAVRNVGWNSEEIVAFRVHLPSKIRYHDAPSKQVERGNILVWEQSLKDRQAGVQVRMEARMETESILYRTLWLFALSGVAVLVTFVAVIWWVVRKGAEPAATAGA